MTSPPKLIHEVIPVGWLQCNCSIVGDPEACEAIVIDPGDNPEEILAVLRRHRLKVKYIVITHAHIDHVGGAARNDLVTSACCKTVIVPPFEWRKECLLQVPLLRNRK